MEHYATGQQVFAGGLVFARLAPILMLIPGFGETFVPARIRLSLALLMALVLFPVVGATVPPIPADVSGVAGAVIKETLLRLMIGTTLPMFMTSLASAGELCPQLLRRAGVQADLFISAVRRMPAHRTKCAPVHAPLRQVQTQHRGIIAKRISMQERTAAHTPGHPRQTRVTFVPRWFIFRQTIE